MSDLITRKPTAPMIELLRQGAASPKGIMTLFDPNCRTLDGLFRRDMAETVNEPGATHSWVIINDRGRAALYKAETAERRAAAEEATRHETAHNAQFLDADGVFRADRSQQAYDSAMDNADQTAREEGFDRYTERWFRVVTSSYASLIDDGAFTEPTPAAEEPVSAPQAAPQRRRAQERPALADIARVVLETVTLGTGDAARVHPSYVVQAYGSTHEFADIDGTWAEVCGRCAGAGVLREHMHIHKGECYGCNRTGLRPDVFTGTEEQRDAFVLAWALKKDRERQRDEKRAAKIHAERVAKWTRWADRNAELITWCLSLTPDSVEEYHESRQSLADTREEAERLYGEDETLVRSGQFDEGFHAGRWWGDFNVVYRSEVFNSYGHRAANLITTVREGDEPLDARSTGLLTKVMRNAVAAEATTRYAGPIDAEVSVTGRVKKTMSVPGFNAWSPSRRMIVLEGTGEHAGITVTAYSGSKAAKSLEEGQEGVTVAGVVSKHKERSGARETAVARPRITVA